MVREIPGLVCATGLERLWYWSEQKCTGLHAGHWVPWWLCSKEFACSAVDAGDMGSSPELGRSSGKGHGNPLQYSCLENTMDRGAWWATVHGVIKSWT